MGGPTKVKSVYIIWGSPLGRDKYVVTSTFAWICVWLVCFHSNLEFWLVLINNCHWAREGNIQTLKHSLKFYYLMHVKGIVAWTPSGVCVLWPVTRQTQTRGCTGQIYRIYVHRERDISSIILHHVSISIMLLKWTSSNFLCLYYYYCIVLYMCVIFLGFMVRFN